VILEPRRGKIFLLILAGGSLAGVFFLKPVHQDPTYHAFADARTFFGIPNFLNVASNLPFVGIGLFGIALVLRKPEPQFIAPWERWPWLALTASILLTGAGSSCYHWVPGDSTLFWDRLPMAIGFGALLGILLAERADPAWGRRLWGPLIAAAVGSVFYWRWAGDLRFYGLLQGWVIALAPALLAAFPGRTSGTGDWILAFVCYALAKGFELEDRAVYQATGWLSGHSLKHLAAGLASAIVVRHLARRTLKSDDGSRSPRA
jgi:hypothetical protein